MNPSTMHSRDWRQRSTEGLVRLESPWGWLGVQDAMKLAAAAYRVASYQARHVQARDVVSEVPGSFESITTEHMTMQEMREAFCECLADVFSDLLSGMAVDRGACWPDEADYSLIASRFLDSVPSDWRPQYPQFGTAEPGKVSQRKDGEQ